MARPPLHQNQLRSLIVELLDVLEKYKSLQLPFDFWSGLLRLLTHELRGSTPTPPAGTASIADEQQAPRRRGRPPGRTKARRGRPPKAESERPARSKKRKRSGRKGGGTVPSDEVILRDISEAKKGITLKDLAVLYKIKPWTALQAKLKALEGAGTIAKAGRVFRIAGAAHPRTVEAMDDAERTKEESNPQQGDSVDNSNDADAGRSGKAKRRNR